METLSINVRERDAELIAANKPEGMDEREFAEYLLQIGLERLRRDMEARPKPCLHLVGKDKPPDG